MAVRVTGGLDDLANGLTRARSEVRTGARRIARETAQDGARTAKRIARFRYGRGHAREYPATITSEARQGGYEYGPTPAGQGNLAPILERGSVNNPAHLNLLHSADIVTPRMHRQVDALLDGLFR